MASVIRVDNIQNSGGTPMFTSDGASMVAASSRFKLPLFNTADLPPSGEIGEVVFDQEESVLKFWDGEAWQSIGRKRVTSSIVGIHWQHWTSTFQSSAEKTYQKITGSEFTFQTKEANSSFLLMADIPGYQANTSSGVNMAYEFNGTLYAGQNGNPGDAWMGSAHSGVATCGFNLKKLWVVSPNLSAGSTCTAACMAGHWSGTSSSHYFLYPGYNPNAEFVILEFVNN